MLTANFAGQDVQYREQVENTSGQFARVRHCSQSKATGYRTYMDWRFGNKNVGANDPSCFKYPFANERYLFLNPTREFWWYDRLVEASQGSMTSEQIRIAWKNLVQPDKAFTNDRQSDYGLGYILNEPGHTAQLRLEPVICTGMTVKLAGESYAKGDGYQWQNFEVIDMLKDDYKSMTLESHWWLIGAATSSINIVGGEQVNPWPKMNGSRMTPYFLWGLGTNVGSIRADWLEPLPADLVKPAYPYLKTWGVADVVRFDERTMQ